MRKHLFAVAALALFLSAGAAAVHAQEGQMDAKAMEEMMMKLAAPGAPHQHLAQMTGNWTARVTMFSPGAEPTTTDGTYEGEMVLGGRYLLGRFHGTMMGQPMEGMSIDGFDNSKNEFFSLWFDNMGTGVFSSTGSLSADGKVATYHGKMAMGPMELPTRSTSEWLDKDTMKFTMWQSMGGQEMKSMEITYKRGK